MHVPAIQFTVVTKLYDLLSCNDSQVRLGTWVEEIRLKAGQEI